MNKKLLAVFALLVVVVSMSAVSASFIDDLFGSKNTTVNVGGVNFTIPSDFKENNTIEQSKEIKLLKSEGHNLTYKCFIKGSDFYEIGVVKDKDNTLNKSAFEANKTTIGNQTGSMTVSKQTVVFSYLKDNSTAVIITSNNKENIEKLFKA